MSSLLRNTTLETVFRPFPKYRAISCDPLGLKGLDGRSLAIRDAKSPAIVIVRFWCAKGNHPAAKGVRQKEFGKKVTKKVTEASEKVTEK